MSVTREVTIWCDGKDCAPTWVQDASTARLLRQDLRKRGWRRVGTRDLCPSCVAKEVDKKVAKKVAQKSLPPMVNIQPTPGRIMKLRFKGDP